MSDNPGSASQQIGLSSFLETDNFVKGMMIYLNGLQKMNQSTTAAASGMSGQLGEGAKRTGDGLSQAGKEASSVGKVFDSLLVKSVALGTFLGSLADRILTSLISKLREMITAGVMVAARVQEMDFVLQVLAQQAGLTKESLDGFIESMREAGIRTDVAQNTLQQFIRYNLDTAKAVDLARAAQDAAVIAGVDSSDMLNRLILGISKFDTMILRTGGINIPSATDAFEKFAEANDLSAKALTNNQKQAAFLDAVLAESARNMGVYEASMEAPGKQLRSLSRHTYELTRLMGAPFLSAFGEIVKMMTNVTKAFRKSVDEGGSLQEMFQKAGALALVFARMLRTAVETGANYLIQGIAAIPDILSSMVDYFTGLASESGEWGANIITNLANGMLAAVSAVIDALMYIGNIITSWLIPGSPPKLLPNLGKWGASAATEWVKGWGKADFSTFNDIAKSVEGFLKTQNIEEGELIPKILGSRKAIAEAISMVNESGIVTEEALDKIMNSAKGLPPTFRDYARAMLEAEVASERLAAATEIFNNANDLTLENADDIISTFSGDMKTAAQNYIQALSQAINQNNKLSAAQEYLNNITTRYDKILKVLNRQLDEMSGTGEDTRLNDINEALASGMLTASEAQSLTAEKRKLELQKQIQLVELQKDKEVDAAQERVDAISSVRDASIQQAEEMRAAMLEIATIQVDAARQQHDALQEQLETQKALISFQTEQNSLVKQQLDLLKRLADAAAAGGGAAGGGLGDVGGLGAGFDIDAIKDEMQEKIQGMADQIQAKFFLFLNKLRTNIILFVTRLPLYQTFKKKFDQLQSTWGGTFEALRTWLEVNIPVAIEFFSNLWETKIVPAFTALKNTYDTYVAPALSGLFAFLGEHGDEIAAFVGGILLVTGGFVALMSAGTALAGLFSTIAGIVTTVTALFVAFTSPIGLIAIAVGLLFAAWQGNWFGMRDTLTEIWTGTIQPALDELWAWLGEKIPEAIGILQGWWEGTLLPALQNVWNWITTTLFPLFVEWYDWLSVKITEAIENLRSWWEDTLLPAFQSVHDWFTGTYFPFWESLRNLLEVIMTKAIGTLKERWDEMWEGLQLIWSWLSGTFKPIWDDIYQVLLDVWSHIYTFLNPVFKNMGEVLTGLWSKIHSIWDIIYNSLIGALDEMYTNWLGNILTAFQDITSVIQTLTTWFGKLADAINGLPPPPPVYEPGSPTPFELGLRGIRDQMQKMYTTDLPKFGSQLKKLPSVGSVTSVPSPAQRASSITNHYDHSKTVDIKVDANYAKTQSKASIYYDVSAAVGLI